MFYDYVQRSGHNTTSARNQRKMSEEGWRGNRQGRGVLKLKLFPSTAMEVRCRPNNTVFTTQQSVQDYVECDTKRYVLMNVAARSQETMNR